MPILSSLDNLQQNAYIILQNGVDNIDIEHMIIQGYGCSTP